MAASQPIDNDVNAATFSIELQNDVDIIPNDRLPSTSIHVMENISVQAHVDVQSHEVEQRHLASQVQEIPLADVEHDDVQGTTDAGFESSNMEHSAPLTPFDIQLEAHQGTTNQHRSY